MHWNRIIMLCWAVLVPGLAQAQQKPYTYEVKEEGGKPVCNETQKGEPSKQDQLRVEVRLPAGYGIEAASLAKAAPHPEVSFPKEGISNPAGGGTLAVLTLDRAAFGTLASAVLKLQVKSGAGASTSLECKNDKGDSISYFQEKEREVGMTEFDGKALQHYLKNGPAMRTTLLGELKALSGREPLLFVHLPSGKVAPPLEDSVSEGQWIQVAFLLPQSEDRVPRATSKNCEVVDLFRQKGTDDSAKEDAKQSKVPKDKLLKMAGEGFKLVPMEKMFQCGAGKLSYEVHPLADYVDASEQAAASGATATATPNMFETRVRPRYHLAATAILGLDTATNRRFEVDQAQAIQEVKDREGLSVYLGAVWMVGGVDYEDMEPRNYFLNVFAAVKPTSPTEDAVVGLALTPTGSLSLALGLSLHRNVRLAKGYTVGAAFTGDGEIPTEKTWKGVRPGVLIGLAVDTNILDALTRKFKPSK